MANRRTTVGTVQHETGPTTRGPVLVVAALLVLLCSAGPVRAQSSGVTVALQGGYDVMPDDESGPGGELVAGYRWDSGVELLAGFGMKFREPSFGCPAAGSGCEAPEGLVTDFEHRFGEARYWFGDWESADPGAGFLGVRMGAAARRSGGFSSRGPTFGVTTGGEFALSPAFALSPSMILDFVDAGEERSASFRSWRIGLRLGLRALIGGG